MKRYIYDDYPAKSIFSDTVITSSISAIDQKIEMEVNLVKVNGGEYPYLSIPNIPRTQYIVEHVSGKMTYIDNACAPTTYRYALSNASFSTIDNKGGEYSLFLEKKQEK